jgi:hypothetical protein
VDERERREGVASSVAVGDVLSGGMLGYTNGLRPDKSAQGILMITLAGKRQERGRKEAG